MTQLEIHHAKYLGSYPDERTCPSSRLPEYAFIGRSNVGKSSLINMLCQRTDLARTSKTPGKTRSINLYRIDDAWLLADLPGYGYAKVSKTERKRWHGMIEKYLLFRPNLISAFVLVDLRHSLQEIDRTFIDWLGARRVPFSIIYTKADKVKPRLRSKHQQRIEQALLESWEALPSSFLSSAQTGEGREALLQYIGVLNTRLEE